VVGGSGGSNGGNTHRTTPPYPLPRKGEGKREKASYYRSAGKRSICENAQWGPMKRLRQLGACYPFQTHAIRFLHGRHEHCAGNMMVEFLSTGEGFRPWY